ncbi:hypothetical protein CVT26_003002 [Gymnopilus dilepis]|uniref:Secreted protein n=1 Tax=Gymnopilus dilepis TaxID=231916 RepID=A0A409Y4F7_9AGAR|nr:hypothetical protein CVT26_003002 [Gymnopilus dilepis]
MWRPQLLHAAFLALVPTPFDGGPQLPPPSRTHLHTLSPPLPLLVLLLFVDSGVYDCIMDASLLGIFTLPGARSNKLIQQALTIPDYDSCTRLCQGLITVSGGDVMLF